MELKEIRGATPFFIAQAYGIINLFFFQNSPLLSPVIPPKRYGAYFNPEPRILDPESRAPNPVK